MKKLNVSQMEDLQGKGKLCDFVNGASTLMCLAGSVATVFVGSVQLGCYIKTL
jgi:hypothetical protein